MTGLDWTGAETECFLPYSQMKLLVSKQSAKDRDALVILDCLRLYLRLFFLILFIKMASFFLAFLMYFLFLILCPLKTNFTARARFMNFRIFLLKNFLSLLNFAAFFPLKLYFLENLEYFLTQNRGRLNFRPLGLRTMLHPMAVSPETSSSAWGRSTCVILVRSETWRWVTLLFPPIQNSENRPQQTNRFIVPHFCIK